MIIGADFQFQKFGEGFSITCHTMAQHGALGIDRVESLPKSNLVIISHGAE